MPRASAAAAGNANLGTDVRVGGLPKNSSQGCGRSGTDVDVGHSFESVMNRARGSWKSKVAEQLASITGRSVRTAERWLSGELTPDGDSTLALFLSDQGPEFLAAKVAELTPVRQEAFWREMGKAWKRAELRQRQEALNREIAELEAEQKR